MKAAADHIDPSAVTNDHIHYHTHGIQSGYGGTLMAIENNAIYALSAAIAIGSTAIAAAMAEKSIGTAAVGAMAEKEELFGKGLIMTALPETLVIFGLVVAILILQLAA